MEILLTQNKKALIDEDIYSLLKKYKWYFSHGYARRSVKNKKEYLHHYIIGHPLKKLVIDHINGDKLDNRKENLRICTHKNNIRNSKISKNNKSGYIGVCFDKKRNKWRANIIVDRKQKFLGRFDTKEEAAVAYNNSVKEYFNEFANLNKI